VTDKAELSTLLSLSNLKKPGKRWIMEPFSFASSEAVEIPVNIRMSVLCKNKWATELTSSQSQPGRRTNADTLLYPH
jgi:hypothetical protein